MNRRKSIERRRLAEIEAADPVKVQVKVLIEQRDAVIKQLQRVYAANRERAQRAHVAAVRAAVAEFGEKIDTVKRCGEKGISVAFDEAGALDLDRMVRALKVVERGHQ